MFLFIIWMILAAVICGLTTWSTIVYVRGGMHNKGPHTKFEELRDQIGINDAEDSSLDDYETLHIISPKEIGL